MCAGDSRWNRFVLRLVVLCLLAELLVSVTSGFLGTPMLVQPTATSIETGRDGSQ